MQIHRCCEAGYFRNMFFFGSPCQVANQSNYKARNESNSKKIMENENQIVHRTMYNLS